MLLTECVQHDYKYFFILQDDFLRLGDLASRKLKFSEKQAYPFAASLRVMETWKNDVLRQLNEAGIDEKDLDEEMLWMDAEWHHFCQRALHIFETNTFRRLLPRVIEAGYARHRYIKRRFDGTRVCDELDQALVYVTYQEARRDKKHPGEIIHQVYFESEAVNKAIAQLNPTPPPAPPPDEGKSAKKIEGAQHAGKTGSLESMEQPSAAETDASHELVTKNNVVSSETITPPLQKEQGANTTTGRRYQDMSQSGAENLQKEQGGSTNTPESLSKKGKTPLQKGADPVQKGQDPLAKNGGSNNSNSKNPPVSFEEMLTSTGGAPAPAAILSHFDFFRGYDQAALLDLFGLIMPLPSYKSKERQQSTKFALEKAAGELADDPIFRERGLVHCARLMYYFADPSSPCSWRKEIWETNPGMQPRPWHLTERVRRIASREMEAANWWPEGLSPETGTDQVEETTVIDLAELSGIEADQRQGMTHDDALGLLAYIGTLLPPEEFPDVFVDYGSVVRFKPARGYYVAFWPINGLEIKMYSDADWQLVWANAALLGSPEFAPRLAEACLAGEVA